MKTNESVIKQPPYILLALIGAVLSLLDYVYQLFGGFPFGTGVLREIIDSPGMAEVFVEFGYLFRGYAIFSFTLLFYNTVFAKGSRHFRAPVRRLVNLALYGAALGALGYFFICLQDYPALMRQVKVTHLLLFLLSLAAARLFVRELSATGARLKVDTTDLSRVDKKPTRNPEHFCIPVVGGWLNLPYPCRGNLGNGGSGAGKSASLAAHILFQMVQNGWTGVVYDLKKFDLTNIVYTAYLHYPEAFEKIPLKIVNFTDPTRTCRMNPIAPRFISTVPLLEQYVATCIKGMKHEWHNPKGDPFFVDEPIALIQGLVLYFSRYLKSICDIPHAFTFLAQSSPEEVKALVEKDVDCATYGKSFTSALGKDAEGQIAGIWSNIQAVARKASIDPLTMWVLSGDEVDFNLNHPDTPGLLCLVNDQQKKEFVSPFLSLATTVARTTMNTQNRLKSCFCFDEWTSLYLPDFDELPNYGRSAKIATWLLQQNFSQVRDRYGKERSENVLGSMGSTFFGSTTELNALKYISELFGKEDRVVKNASTGSSVSSGTHDPGRETTNDNISFNVQEKNILRTQDISQLSVGEFAGKIVGRKPNSFFRAQLKRFSDATGVKEDEYKVPSFASGVDIERNKERIQNNIYQLKQTLI
ncbi:MAG: TraM recognition domain-containing protein [Prevotellaceae bacterium]|jgi:hypothetical protein|nr:TraM recognition domain-containing protein [Prevotellaceae bacterium]